MVSKFLNVQNRLDQTIWHSLGCDYISYVKDIPSLRSLYVEGSFHVSIVEGHEDMVISENLQCISKFIDGNSNDYMAIGRTILLY